MPTDMQLVFVIVALASLLFASGLVRFDVIASLVIMVLVLAGILTPEEAFAGFGNPVVVMLAGLLIVAEILTRTGAVYAIGQWFGKYSDDSESRLLVLVMLVAALMGSVISATVVVAVLLPAVMKVGQKSSIAVSHLLMPLSYAALISGMLTLIGMPSNLIMVNHLEQMGHDTLGLFSFAPVGLALLLGAMVYMLLLGRRLLPTGRDSELSGNVPDIQELAEEYGLDGRGRKFVVPADSPLVGLRIKDSLLARYPLQVLIVQRARKYGSTNFASPDGETLIRPGDTLFALTTEMKAIRPLMSAAKLEAQLVSYADHQSWTREVGVATVLVHPASRWIGTSISEGGFRNRYRLQVIGVRRDGKALEDYTNLRLEGGDALLVVGSWSRIARFQSDTSSFVLLTRVIELENYVPRLKRAPIAVAIVAAMVVLLALDVFPMVLTVLLAVGAGVITGCISMDEVYKSIPWSTIVLVAGMLPIALALEKTGGVDVIVDVLAEGIGHYGPYAMLTALFFLSAGLGFFLSNIAIVVLMAPIALRMAEIVQVDPHPFAMTVAIAATAAFMTPNSTPVASLVMEPGGYRRMDFVKVGLPLLLFTWAVSLVLLPLLYPFVP